MVKNREELIQVAQNNANQMKTHLRSAIVGFLNAQHVSPDELAYVLGITTNEMKQILEGDGNITVDALSKLLVATDMAVEIKPVRQTPLGGYGHRMPRSGGYPAPGGMPGGIHVGPDGKPLPPPPGFAGMPGGMFAGTPHVPGDDRQEVPMETTGPVRDSHGRFVKKAKVARRKPVPAPTPAPQFANPYIGLGDAELVNIIRQNIWDGEIDINHATHEQLAEFVANKERIMRERTEAPAAPTAPQAEARQEAPVNGGGGSLNQFLEMLGNMAREAQNNPQLAETIARFMPRQG